MPAFSIPMAGLNDTIYALSSGALPAGIAVVRISGSSSQEILTALGGFGDPRTARLTTLRSRDAQVLDQALTLFFPAGMSFTGEPVAELHLHGGRAVLRAVFDEIACFPNTRLAEAGEFTRRAFLNGRMDLTAAEGVADLIAAETEAQRRFAVSNAAGQQADLYTHWRERLIEARALIEADLDFSDEGDVPGSVADAVLEQVQRLRVDVQRHLEDAKRGEIIREGFRVVILGEPNVGKSSLLNALARREVAIVADEPGTTRDLIDVALDLNGYKVIFTDTAGLRETENRVEQQGIFRAREAAGRADLVLFLHLAGTEPQPLAENLGAPVWNIATKSDLAEVGPSTTTAISTLTGSGVSEVLNLIAAAAAETAGISTSVVPSHERQVGHLRRAVDCLLRSEREIPLELRAEELRLAADELGHITGEVGVEDLLDVVFSRFCIGK